MERSKGTLILLALLVAGCGGDEGERTPYGRVEEVRQYRERLNAVIDQINAVERELRDLAVGSTGRATGQNLAAACQSLQERLQAALKALEGIAPPRKLRAVHADMQRAVELRLDACARIAQAWQVEQERSFAEAEPMYDEAEALLAQANQLLEEVNQVLEEVDAALAQEERNPVG
jgi:DNA repair exonuclease SbcCD ATPase subunit